MNAVEEGRQSLEFLEQAVEDKKYDCTCQVGGVDALSIDSDFLANNMDRVALAFRVMEAATDSERLTESQDFVSMVGLVEVIKGYAERWADPDDWVHAGHDKTFFANLILEWIGELFDA